MSDNIGQTDVARVRRSITLCRDKPHFVNTRIRWRVDANIRS